MHYTGDLITTQGGSSQRSYASFNRKDSQRRTSREELLSGVLTAAAENEWGGCWRRQLPRAIPCSIFVGSCEQRIVRIHPSLSRSKPSSLNGYRTPFSILLLSNAAFGIIAARHGSCEPRGYPGTPLEPPSMACGCGSSDRRSLADWVELPVEDPACQRLGARPHWPTLA